MKIISQKNIPQQAAVEKLDEIQQQMRDMCQPHYDEFYKVTTQHGFVKITIPKNRA